jgi:hypothetical protein
VAKLAEIIVEAEASQQAGGTLLASQGITANRT